MSYTNLTTEQAAKLAQALGPEFTASAKNDLLNFADAIIGRLLSYEDNKEQVETKVAKAPVEVRKAEEPNKVASKSAK